MLISLMGSVSFVLILVLKVITRGKSEAFGASGVMFLFIGDEINDMGLFFSEFGSKIVMEFLVLLSWYSVVVLYLVFS